MKYHHAETAAQHLTAAVARARPDELVGEVRGRLMGHELEDTELVCVVDGEGRLVGLLAFAELLRLPADAAVGRAMRHAPPAVQAHEDQEKVASIALHYGLNSLPVVDAGRRLLGVVPTRALLQILRHEHVEDLHRFAGIQRETSIARHALDAPPLRRARDRLPWLILGLAGSALATFVMSRFEAALNAKLALAFFVPGLVYLADAIGTQTEAVAVRGLSLAHVGIGRLLGGELRTGLIIGLVLGGLTWPAVWLAFGDVRLASAVAGALLVAGGLASTVGLALPWALMRMKRDPAFGSGPLATVIQDVLTLLTYFAFISLLY
ncbi:MAG: magnesium transporter [Thiobacillaceae bacterium]|jgi:magnesium transporter|nr:magnesium transporter [Thiobacillaceae bacterium]